MSWRASKLDSRTDLHRFLHCRNCWLLKQWVGANHMLPNAGALPKTSGNSVSERGRGSVVDHRHKISLIDRLKRVDFALREGVLHALECLWHTQSSGVLLACFLFTMSAAMPVSVTCKARTNQYDSERICTSSMEPPLAMIGIINSDRANSTPGS